MAVSKLWLRDTRSVVLWRCCWIPSLPVLGVNSTHGAEGWRFPESKQRCCVSLWAVRAEILPLHLPPLLSSSGSRPAVGQGSRAQPSPRRGAAELLAAWGQGQDVPSGHRGPGEEKNLLLNNKAFVRECLPEACSEVSFEFFWHPQRLAAVCVAPGQPGNASRGCGWWARAWPSLCCSVP